MTFDGGSSRGDFDRYLWRDESTGATSSGPVWTVTLDGGQHMITLTVVSDRQGGIQNSASVPVDVLIAEQAPPEVGAILGQHACRGVGGPGVPPVCDPIARIQLFGRFEGACVDEKRGGDALRRRPAGSHPAGRGRTVRAPRPRPGRGRVTFFTGYDFCPAGDQFGPAMDVEVWAVAYTDRAGQRGESEHIIRP